MHSIRSMVISLLKALGIHNSLKRILTRLSPTRRKYRKITRFSATIDNLSLEFSTADEYSNTLFYPRYADGSLYEEQVTKQLLSTLKQDDVFIDIGTNLGWFTCIASKFLVNGTVHGFEMDPVNYELLQTNLKLNECHNVLAHNLAVSDKIETIKFRRENTAPSLRSKILSDSTPSEINGLLQEIQSITLDQYCDEKNISPKLIKMDVEGAEYKVLQGMQEVMRNHQPHILIEVHPILIRDFNQHAEDVTSLLENFGYNLTVIESIDTNQLPVSTLSPGSAIPVNCMIYAIPRSGTASNHNK